VTWPNQGQELKDWARVKSGGTTSGTATPRTPGANTEAFESRRGLFEEFPSTGDRFDRADLRQEGGGNEEGPEEGTSAAGRC
jgi:hypothetical protein